MLIKYQNTLMLNVFCLIIYLSNCVIKIKQPTDVRLSPNSIDWMRDPLFSRSHTLFLLLLQSLNF